MVNITTPAQALKYGAYKTQLAKLYKQSDRVFRCWLKPLKEEPPPGTYAYTPAQVRKIFDALGDPPDKD